VSMHWLTEYIRIHKIGLEQDLERFGNYLDDNDKLSYEFIRGQVEACAHILEVINERQ
jgi:hypothetical protein